MMNIITTKTNGQFPSRKNGETNVLRPVVSRSPITDGQICFHYSILMSATALAIIFLFFIAPLWAWKLVIFKLVRLLFSILGLPSLGLLAFLTCFWMGDNYCYMMTPEEGSSAGAGTSSSNPEAGTSSAEVLFENEARSRELEQRLRINTVARPLPEKTISAILRAQMEIENKISEALLSDGIAPDLISENRHKIRGILFYPQGKALSLSTYLKHLSEMEVGTHRSLLYKRLLQAHDKYDIDLAFPPLKKNSIL